MNVFVTGGAGYVGCVVVESLVAAGARVVVFDNLSGGHRAAVHPDARFVYGDLADQAALLQALLRHEPDVVMHFAANALVGESMEAPMLYLGDNLRNGVNLLEACQEAGVGRFVLSSTANLFSQGGSQPLGETATIAPASPYGESKYVLERMLGWLDRLGKMRFVALRYFNAAGASADRGEDHFPESHLIPRALQVAQGIRDRLTIFGDDYDTRDGTCVRDYVHVLDLAAAHVLALEVLDSRSRTYNLGSGEGVSVRQVLAAVEEVTGRAIAVEMGPRRAGDPDVLIAAHEAIAVELGWRPRRSCLASIIESAWGWRERNPWGYRMEP